MDALSKLSSLCEAWVSCEKARGIGVFVSGAHTAQQGALDNRWSVRILETKCLELAQRRHFGCYTQFFTGTKFGISVTVVTAGPGFSV